MTSLVVLFAACGGSDKPKPKKPKKEVVEAPPKAETDEQREAKRDEARHAIVPESSTCLPTSLKENGAPRLELAALETAAVVCAVDVDESRLLGPVGCWTVDLASGALAYKAPSPLPGHSFGVSLEDKCARGYCLPSDSKSGRIAHITWNIDGSKVAIVAGDEVHTFDAGSKAHEKTFSIRGDKQVTGDATGVYWVADMIFVEAKEGTTDAVWSYKSDGTFVGAVNAVGAKDDKPLSINGGSFSVLDKTRVGLSEQGLSTLTIVEADSGKKTKSVRKLAKPPCKADELTAYWADGSASGKCKEFMDKQFGTLIGATAVAGSKNLLVMMRGDRLGELAVTDPKTLSEKKAIKLPWCEGKPAGETSEKSE
ncbi:MAG TPA: hypothetical protein VGM90_29725 [Kofleriaceae bacterium]|jgi:hypothetical protein